MKDLLESAKKGFQSLDVSSDNIDTAVTNLEEWLSDERYSEYVGQIEHLIEQKRWDYLMDSFYQVIPFGTGGRRGEVGIGPNRINQVTIQDSAQGHAQYLLSKYDDEAKQRGVVLAYDVRVFNSNEYLSDEINNPVDGLDGIQLAKAAAEVYTANGVKVFLFDAVRTTPELSFAIKHLNTVGGDMFSASHNPPEHNGKKVYDEFGGQLIPPYDQELVKEVTEKVEAVEQKDFDQAVDEGLIEYVGSEVDDAYVQAVTEVALSDKRDLVIAYTPLHGCGMTSVPKILTRLGFSVHEDPKTSNPSGSFENITFNIPNPEVIESFDTPLEFAKEIDADILLNSDPDADRIGLMVKHDEEWRFMNGNEIAAVLAEYVTLKRKESLNGQGVMIKTGVTTNLLAELCKANDLEIVGDLLVGFKYIGDEMNKLEEQGRIDNFLFGCEESHGYIAGNYARDKDAAVAAVWLSELAAECKEEGTTIIDYLDNVYAKYGYFKNYLTEIRMLGATGVTRIKQIQQSLRDDTPKQFGEFKVKSFEDVQNREPIVSDTDLSAKNILVFELEPPEGIKSVQITVRPSGTEPKSKMYFEIGTESTTVDKLPETRKMAEELLQRVERAFMLECYRLIGVDFPERGFLLFWQLPLDAKLEYFKIEPEIEELKNVEDAFERKARLEKLLSFLGSDPILKVDKAFKEKNSQTINEFLDLK